MEIQHFYIHTVGGSVESHFKKSASSRDMIVFLALISDSYKQACPSLPFEDSVEIVCRPSQLPLSSQ